MSSDHSVNCYHLWISSNLVCDQPGQSKAKIHFWFLSSTKLCVAYKFIIWLKPITYFGMTVLVFYWPLSIINLFRTWYLFTFQFQSDFLISQGFISVSLRLNRVWGQKVCKRILGLKTTLLLKSPLLQISIWLSIYKAVCSIQWTPELMDNRFPNAIFNLFYSISVQSLQKLVSIWSSIFIDDQSAINRIFCAESLDFVSFHNKLLHHRASKRYLILNMNSVNHKKTLQLVKIKFWKLSTCPTPIPFKIFRSWHLLS